MGKKEYRMMVCGCCDMCRILCEQDGESERQREKVVGALGEREGEKL